MLQLRYEEVLPRIPGKLRLRDITGAYDAASNPGGYGGPNPTRNALAIFALAAEERPNFQAGAQYWPSDYDPTVDLHFTLSVPPLSSGLLQVFVFAVPLVAPAAGAEPGTLWLDDTGRLLKKLSAGSLLGAQEVQVEELTLQELRDALPAIITESETIVPVLDLRGVREQADALLLLFCRGGNAERRREDAQRDTWLNAEATISSIDMLHQQGRLPEAAAQLVALQRQLRGGLPLPSTSVPTLNSWSTLTPGQ